MKSAAEMGAVRRVAWQSPMLNRAPLPTAAVPAIGGTLAHQPAVSSAIAEKPVRVDFFGVAGLERHAEELAATHYVASRPTIDNRLERRLRDNERALRKAYVATMGAARDPRSVPSFADWLLDNFHVAQEQMRAIRTDLLPGIHKQLPSLIDGPFQGYPRVFGLLWSFVDHCESHFDAQMLFRFVRAYRNVQPLTMGELWAVATALRVVLVENFRHLAEDMVTDRAVCQETSSSAAQALVAALGRVGTPLPTTLAVQPTPGLCERDPAVAPPSLWLNAIRAAPGTAAKYIFEVPRFRRGIANMAIGNVIGSMRLMSSIDWRELQIGHA